MGMFRETLKIVGRFSFVKQKPSAQIYKLMSSLTQGGKRALASKHDIQVPKHAKTISTFQSPSSPCKVGCLNIDNTPRDCFEEFDIPNVLSQTTGLNSDVEVDEENNMDFVIEKLRGKVIEIEGNIGCGKSTLSSQLQKLFNEKKPDLATLHSEMVNNVFLKAFYDEPKRLGFAFQMYMLTTRLGQINKAVYESKTYDKISLLDRGAVGDVLFALNNHQEGNITSEDLEIYKSVCNQRFPHSLSDDVNIVLYLDVSPEECWRRMIDVRQRDAEKNVPPTYLYTVDYVYYELLAEWLGNRNGVYFNMNVGAAPPLRVINWENFGCTKHVAKLMANLSLDSKDNAAVHFVTELDTNTTYTAVLTTEEQIDAYYNAYVTAQKNKETTFQYDEKTILTQEPVHVAINYEINRKTHHISRRLGFKLMEAMSTISYFGPNAVATTQK